MDQPHEIHWKAAKRILSFVQGTRTHGIFYKANSDLELIGFTDSDWAGDSIDRKSTSGMCSCLQKGQSAGQARNRVPLHSHLQKLSTEELSMQQLSVYGCRVYLESVVSNLSTQLPSTVITRVPFESARIQFRSREPDTLRFTCTTSESLCMMAPFTYSSVHLQNK